MSTNRTNQQLERKKLSAEIKSIELDHAIKEAQERKLCVETEKVGIEKEQAKIQLAETRKELRKSWWLKKEFHARLTRTLVGISILGFYFNYMLIPAYNAENAQLKTENAKAGYQHQLSVEKLHVDSLKLLDHRRRLDSLGQQLATVLSEKRLSDSIYIVLLNSKKRPTSSDNNELNSSPLHRSLAQRPYYSIPDSSIRVSDEEINAYVMRSIGGNACQAAHY